MWTIENFKNTSKGKLTFPTKFDMVEPILPLDHQGKVIIRVSVNPEEIINKVEFGTSRLKGRIEAINKLKEKLERLENERERIKEREHEQWELTNIGANIRETKKRIERLEKLENLEFPDINFVNGKAIHNKEINRIQLIFDEIPNPNIRKELKHCGFHWSRQEKSMQREFNYNGIRATKKDYTKCFESG